MIITIDLPKSWELDQLTLSEDGTRITIVPRFSKTSRTCTLAYLKAVGDTGREERAVLQVSKVNGKFTTSAVEYTPDPVDFDKPEDLVNGGEASH